MAQSVYGNLRTIKDLLAFSGQPVGEIRDIHDAARAAAIVCEMDMNFHWMSMRARKLAIQALWDRSGTEWVAAGMPSHRAVDPMKGEPGWAKLRYEVLIEQKRTCQLCGATPAIRPVEVDHIVPRHIAPDRILDKTNLRVLCEMCNGGRGLKPHPDDMG